MTRAARGSRFSMRSAVVLVAAPALVAFGFGGLSSNTVEWPMTGFPEPSGIVFHPSRKTLFVVGDEGDIGEVSLDGKLLHQSHLGGDLEAITVNPRDGLLYVVREGHEVIFEIRPDNFKLLRRFTIDRSWHGDPNYLRRGGDGVEGLTFVPDDKDPEGGRLWVVNQYDPPVLIELSIPLQSSKDRFQIATIARAIPVDSAPLSEVTWDAATHEFLIASALWKRVSVLDAAGNYERSVRVPGFMPEGMALLPDGRVAIAQDSGGIVIWNPESDPFRGEAATGPPAPAAAKGSTAGKVATAPPKPLVGDAGAAPAPVPVSGRAVPDRHP